MILAQDVTKGKPTAERLVGSPHGAFGPSRPEQENGRLRLTGPA
jgi:hypothetical protein